MDSSIAAYQIAGDFAARRGYQEVAEFCASQSRAEIECENCNGTGEIGAGHPDDARPCGCRPPVEEIPY